MSTYDVVGIVLGALLVSIPGFLLMFMIVRWRERRRLNQVEKRFNDWTEQERADYEAWVEQNWPREK